MVLHCIPIAQDSLARIVPLLPYPPEYTLPVVLAVSCSFRPQNCWKRVCIADQASIVIDVIPSIFSHSRILRQLIAKVIYLCDTFLQVRSIKVDSYSPEAIVVPGVDLC